MSICQSYHYCVAIQGYTSLAFCTEETFHLITNGFRLFVGVKVMVFNATFNNISAISWQSVLLAEETGSTRRKPRLFVVFHTETLWFISFFVISVFHNRTSFHIWEWLGVLGIYASLVKRDSGARTGPKNTS